MYRQNSFGTDAPKYEVMPSKCDHVRVKVGDVLEWITWGGGGLGDPLTRPAELVALEVHRRLVTVDGAKRNYGVVVDGEDFSVDEEATNKARNEMRDLRPADWAEVVYNRGGSIDELREVCLEETGMEPPQPLWKNDPYGPHVKLDYVKNWYMEMREKGGWTLDNKVIL